jgi:beta-lactamase class A
MVERERPEALAHAKFAQLETALNGRLGVFAIDTGTGASLGHHADQRFPFCSTFKAVLAAGILEESARNPGVMQKRIMYTQADLVAHSPVTEKHVEDGMTVADLCAATMAYSDNTAANLLLHVLGGPPALTTLMRSIGDPEFRLDRYETDLNTAIPDDPRDTSTPRAMARSLQKLALGDALNPKLRQQLQVWLLSNTTGAELIQAGVPADWKVGDRSGGGRYGTRNDIAVLWPPHRAPIILAVYTTQHEEGAKWREDIVASAARIVVNWLS